MPTSVNAVPVITIDGPAASGKGTVAVLLARQLGWHYLDSGAIYRALAFAVEASGKDVNDIDALVEQAHSMGLVFELTGTGVSVALNGQPVGDGLRTEQCGALASRIAAIPEVRAALLVKQRAFCWEPGLVAEGRDMGTVVFPQAALKIFLTANIEERAERRHKQLMGKGLNDSLAQILEGLRARDERDQERGVAPLQPAEDAVLIDTTSDTPRQVVDQVLQLYRGRQFADKADSGFSPPWNF